MFPSDISAGGFTDVFTILFRSVPQATPEPLATLAENPPASTHLPPLQHLPSSCISQVDILAPLLDFLLLPSPAKPLPRTCLPVCVFKASLSTQN